MVERRVEHGAVVAGGGPTGLMLAAELRLAGADVVVVERRTSQGLDGSRAGGLHARTVEVLDQRGVAERFVSAGQPGTVFGFSQVPLDMRVLPTRHAFVLALWQKDIERILAGWVLDELGVPILRGREVVGLEQDEDGVDVALSDGTTLRTAWLIGCDGGRSIVRKSSGIDFPGLDPTTSWIRAEVQMDEQPELGFRRDASGRQHAIGQRHPSEPVGVVIMEDEVAHDHPPTLEELRALLQRIWGTDYGLRSASWITRFDDTSRQAAAYRTGRVLVAGDAAHIHPPQGGQGLNVGVQDAVNLGWKLAQVLRGTSSEALLDTYHAERHPVGARVQQNTQAQIALATTDERHQSLRDLLGELLAVPEAHARIAAMLSGLDVHYDLGPGHPLLGRRLPDVDLATEAGGTRAHALLHDARPVLLHLDGPASDAAAPWADRVHVVSATAVEDRWELPVLGEVEAPPAVLVRPDGHVAWTGTMEDPSLPEAMATWFGAPAPA